MSRRKQIKPRHFDTEVDGEDAEPKDGESLTTGYDEMALTLDARLDKFARLTSHSCDQSECEELRESELTRPNCGGGQDYAGESEETGRMIAEEEEEGEGDEDDEGEDAEAMYDYFMSCQGGDAENNNVVADTTTGDVKDGTNVKLKTIQSTKVAVAQFAENNLAPADFLMLQSTLYGLQQQQLYQLQLLQTIQQQLVAGISPTMIANLRRLTSLPPVASPMMPPLMPASSGSLTTVTTVTTVVSVADRDSKYTMAYTPSTCMSMSPLKMLSSLKTPASITTPTADLLPLPQSMVTPGDSNDSALFNKAKSPNVTVSGTVLPREQYAADDPFFKHKCRFCHKVFGSDSALQIHIRSHTGERPYKCNICANRFSTKGNLKVHFTRHKASYPDVKMNDTIFPEHLDRPPKPIQSGPPIVTSLPVVSPLAANHMPAFSHMTLSMKDRNVDVADDVSRRSQHGDSISQLGEAVHSNEASRNSFMDDPSMRPLSAMSGSCIETPLPTNVSSPGLSSSSSTPSPAMTPTAYNHQSLPMACLSSMVPPLPQALMSSVAPTLPPFGFEPLRFYSPSPSILPSAMEDPMEQFMEVQKSETSKLEQLVKNIESKLTDPNQCAICHRILSCKSALLMHYRTHTGERPFKCRICGRAFTTKGNLKTHMGVHRAKPPVRMMHQCPVCHKQFTNALVLQQHVRMHTGELPKDFTLHNDMLAASAAMNYMPPFPGFPFLPLPPTGLPATGLPQHPLGAAGELDLRKPKLEGHNGDRENGEVSKVEYVTPGKRRGSEEEMNREPWSNEASNNEDSNEVNVAAYKRPKMDDDEVKSSVSESDSKCGEKDGDSSKDGETEEDLSHTPSFRRPSSAPHASTPPALVPLSQVLSASKPDMIYQPYNNPPVMPMSYSSSLLAMEDRIRSIDMSAPHFLSMGHPLEHMENIIRRADTNLTSSSRVSSIESRSPAAMKMMPRPPSGSDRRSPTEDSLTAASPTMAASPGDSGRNHLERNGGSEHSFGTSSAFMDETSGTTCNICFKTFACRSALDIHYRSHSSERPYKCEACDRSFSTHGNMKQHMLTHKIRDLPTDAFDSMEALITSTPLKGTESGAVRLGDALPKLESMSLLKTQSEGETDTSYTKHNMSPPGSSGDNSQSPFVRRPNLKHMCLVCQKPFSSASALQIHMRTHTGDKPFKCNVCGKAFTTKGNLKVHMGTHMWNNSPSRRGRRMSIDPRPTLTPTSSPKDAEFFNTFAHHPPPPPDMYPFPFPPSFPNGFMSPKMNEISVIQGLNGGMNPIMPLPPTTEAMMGHFPASFAENMLRSQFAVIASSQQQHRPDEHPLKANDAPRKPTDLPINGLDAEKRLNGSSGELDLSIRKSESSTPSSISSSLEQHSMDAAHNATWIWKTTCHLCSKVCSSASALEMHMKGHLQAHNEELTSKPLVA